VNGADFTVWKGAFGSTNAADADGDGDSDGSDFLAWQRARGAVSAVTLGMGVPEPGAGVLAALTLGLLARQRRQGWHATPFTLERVGALKGIGISRVRASGTL